MTETSREDWTVKLPAHRPHRRGGRPRKDGTPARAQDGTCYFCWEPMRSRGMCWGHYARWGRSGRPDHTMTTNRRAHVYRTSWYSTNTHARSTPAHKIPNVLTGHELALLRNLVGLTATGKTRRTLRNRRQP